MNKRRFPQPEYIGTRRFWRLSALLRFEGRETDAVALTRRALRLQAVAIRRNLIAILRAPSPFARPVTIPVPDSHVAPPDAPRIPRRVAVRPQQTGAP